MLEMVKLFAKVKGEKWHGALAAICNTHCKYISGFRKCISVSAGADKVLQWQTRVQTNFSSTKMPKWHAQATHTLTHTHHQYWHTQLHYLSTSNSFIGHSTNLVTQFWCNLLLSWLSTWKLIGFHLIWFSLSYSCWLIIKCLIDNRVILCRIIKMASYVNQL